MTFPAGSRPAPLRGDAPTGWALDLDGVVWLADKPIPGASDAVAQLREAGHPVLFVTNNSAVRVREVEEKLAGMGISAAGQVVTSAVVAADLVSTDEVALVCAGPGVREALLDRGVAVVGEGDADVVVVGYHRDFDYERMTVAARAVRRGARLLATNDDPTYPTPDGPIPGGGAILASIAVASGVEATVAGKPHVPMVAHVRRRLGAGGVMVGDRPDTDGLFARALGYRFALVLSGVTGPGDLPVEPTPDLVAGDLVAAVEAELR
ncbi:MAG: HAD-IIA family hydrolase [Acidimicrobiia bacterium]|nr:HAD-IIA family hydrolase [Acidimicrobiia bacterium]